MSCDSPQYLIDGGVVPCGICYKCEVQNRWDRRKRSYEFRSRVRNYGGLNAKA